MARIIFLGTSNANPHPDRLQSGIVLEVDSNFYLFDCGDGIASAIWNREDIIMNFIHCVFVTHYHADHAGGLMALLLLMHQRIKRSQGLQPGRDGEGVSIFLPTAEGARLMEESATLMHGGEFAYGRRFLPYPGEGMVYRDDDIAVRAFPTNHTPESRGFVIEAAGKVIVHSGDAKAPSIASAVASEAGADIVIHELAHFDNKSLAKAFEKSEITDLIITHMHDSRIGNQAQVLADMKRWGPRGTRITIARDGLDFSLDTG